MLYASFTNTFKYCDADPECLHKPHELLALCQITEGATNTIHSDLEIHPGTFPFPLYSEIAVVGKQTICLDIGDVGFGKLTPLCFNFVITETLKKSTRAKFGIRAKAWTGYYTLDFGQTCAGFEPIECNSPV